MTFYVIENQSQLTLGQHVIILLYWIIWIIIVCLLNYSQCNKDVQISKYMVIMFQIRNIICFLDFEQRYLFRDFYQLNYSIQNLNLNLFVNQFFVIYLFNFWKSLPFIITICIMSPLANYILFRNHETITIWVNLEKHKWDIITQCGIIFFLILLFYFLARSAVYEL